MLRKTIYNIPLFRETISKIPMRISLPLLFAAPVVGVVIVLSAIAFLEGQSAANDLMEQNLAQIQDRIEERLNDLLDSADKCQPDQGRLARFAKSAILAKYIVRTGTDI
jgi:hypothetical protein